jgi:Zn-finger nucleic acid-binding protein
MTLACPRCANALVGRRIEDVVVHECPECEGVFLDENAIGLVLQDHENKRARALVDSLPRRPHSPLPSDGKLYVKCPTCSTSMNRKLFAQKSGIVVDVCRNHGTFFDAGELPAIMDFVMSGELAKAESKKTVERVPVGKQPDGFAKQVLLARMDRRANYIAAQNKADLGAGFVELLFHLLA